MKDCSVAGDTSSVTLPQQQRGVVLDRLYLHDTAELLFRPTLCLRNPKHARFLSRIPRQVSTCVDARGVRLIKPHVCWRKSKEQVGEGASHWRLRSDSRVHCLPRRGAFRPLRIRSTMPLSPRHEKGVMVVFFVSTVGGSKLAPWKEVSFRQALE